MCIYLTAHYLAIRLGCVNQSKLLAVAPLNEEAMTVVYVCVCVCVLILLHITAQFGRTLLISLTGSLFFPSMENP